MVDEQKAAITNRSLRTIRTELEYLTDAAVITPQQLATFLAQLPQQTVLHAPITTSGEQTAVAATTASTTTTTTTSTASPAPSTAVSPAPAVHQLTSQFNNTGLSEKQQGSAFAPPPPAPNTSTSPHPMHIAMPPPPAYAATASVAIASALYEYHPTDAGDLAISPHDRIFVTEFMNADWAKGRNERTGLDGIFPRSYVAIVEDKSSKMGLSPPPVPLAPQVSGYGNMPVDVMQAGSSQQMQQQQQQMPSKHSKFEEQGKKFGKKMGNAAIFGAGATIGSNIVNGIF